MKKNLLLSYVDGIFDHAHGGGYTQILKYFFPEFITAIVLYSVMYLIDSRWISDLKSTSMYDTVGVTNILIHMITKMAEGFSVGTTVMTGHHNGLHQDKEVGKSLVNAFWVIVIAGGVIASSLYFGAYWIYYWYNVPEKMISLGVPFLRIKALGIFFMFVFFALVGFLRGIKKPRVAMNIFLAGAGIFLFFDYALIFGKWGFPECRLQGSAMASTIQYACMLCMAVCYILFDRNIRRFGINLFTEVLNKHRVIELLHLSWPVILDKTILAASYLWLGQLINPMGKYAIASYIVIKDLERFAIQPAAAFAQVITYLVSNAHAVRDWDGIKSNIKKVIFLSSLIVFSILFVFSLWPHFFIQIFDQKGKFTEFSAKVFPILSVLVFFDLLQLILSGALRGAADVKIVMWVRLAVCVGYFVPVSWLLSMLPITNPLYRFLLVYGSFYIGNALMSIVYIQRFRTETWKSHTIE